MPDHSTGQLATGAHRTNREFADQLTAWGFAQRKVDGVHGVWRGPHGGTLRVLRSLLGRADTHVVAKAARLAGVTVDRFWTGPDGPMPEPRRATPSNDDPSTDALTAEVVRPGQSAARDRVTSLVLGVHAAADRPLGFDQVVELAEQRVTRDQVRTASAQLCREGDLDRIRSGVYQWSGGVRARAQLLTTAPSSATATPTSPATATRTSAAQMFDQLFPSGVRMTADLLTDFERWAALTEKLTQHAQAS